MDDRDVSDPSRELHNAADVNLMRDFAEETWRKGQRERQKTAWAVGGVLVAAVAAATLLVGPVVGVMTTSESVTPAGVSTTGPAPQDGDSASPTTPLQTDGQPDPTGASDDEPSNTEGQSAPDGDLTPLSNGVSIRPIPGWQVTHQRLSGEPGETIFESCLQPEGPEVTRSYCGGGISITTGLTPQEVDEEEELADVKIPELGTTFYLTNSSDDDPAVDSELGFSTVSEALDDAPNSVQLFSAQLNTVEFDDEVTAVVERTPGDFSEPKEVAPSSEVVTGPMGLLEEGQKVGLALQGSTMCTQDQGPDTQAKIVDCAGLASQPDPDPDLTFSVVYDETGAAWRISENPRSIG